MAQEEELELKELVARLKKLGIKGGSRRSLMRIRAKEGEGNPLRLNDDGKIVGDLQAVIAYLSQNSPSSPPTPSEDASAAQSKPPPKGLLDPDKISGAAGELELDLDDPAIELRSAGYVLRQLDTIFRAFDLSRLRTPAELKSFQVYAEAHSRTLTRISEAREKLLETKIRAGKLLEEAEVERAFDELGEFHRSMYEEVPGLVIKEVMAVLAEQGIPPSFDSSLLKDRLKKLLEVHRERMANVIEEVGADV